MFELSKGLRDVLGVSLAVPLRRRVLSESVEYASSQLREEYVVGGHPQQVLRVQ